VANQAGQETRAGHESEVTERVGYQLKRAQHALRSAMDRDLRDIGLTTPQYAALSALSSAGRLSGAELARRCFVTPQTMNAIVVKLEAEQMIARAAHAEHGRVIEAQLTREGRVVLRRAHSAVKTIEARMVKGLSKLQRERLIVALRHCAGNLDPTMEKDP
jgi:DNA-binding MarR family transcriptional regulator